MRLKIRENQEPDSYHAFDMDHPNFPLDESIVGWGVSFNEAIGQAMHDAWISGDAILEYVVADWNDSCNECGSVIGAQHAFNCGKKGGAGHVMSCDCEHDE